MISNVFYLPSETMRPLRLLMQELSDVAANWMLFMTELGLKKRQLDIIDCDHPKVREKLLKALDSWLHSKRDASWADIVFALQGIEEKVLASHIEKKYCQSD